VLSVDQVLSVVIRDCGSMHLTYFWKGKGGSSA
jgi:hypothetical protein